MQDCAVDPAYSYFSSGSSVMVQDLEWWWYTFESYLNKSSVLSHRMDLDARGGKHSQILG